MAKETDVWVEYEIEKQKIIEPTMKYWLNEEVEYHKEYEGLIKKLCAKFSGRVWG